MKSKLLPALDVLQIVESVVASGTPTIQPSVPYAYLDTQAKIVRILDEQEEMPKGILDAIAYAMSKGWRQLRFNSPTFKGNPFAGILGTKDDAVVFTQNTDLPNLWVLTAIRGKATTVEEAVRRTQASATIRRERGMRSRSPSFIRPV